MPLFTESEIRARAKQATGLYESTATILNRRMEKQAGVREHDIFLSHAYDDRELVLGTVSKIEDLGFSVYIDWRDDPALDRTHVSKETAETLRSRMRNSKCLFYSTTAKATASKWMPWELGYMDGRNSRTAVLPISLAETAHYEGQEYLGIYPYVNKEPDKEGKQTLWIQHTPSCYVSFSTWLAGKDPYERT